MSISVDWGTKVITVPKSYTTLIQSTPSEIRELPLNQFRLDLKALEASAPGMPHLVTHRHNTEVLLGGIVYARTIEIINGYTITFEDGQYAVNLTGANSNVGDVVNVNQVSVRSQNAAGLISNSAIEYSSFDGFVTIDVTTSNVGTVYPTGTLQRPVNNLDDALLIAQTRGISRLRIIGDYTFQASDVVNDFEIWGEGLQQSVITCISGSQLNSCEIVGALLEGETSGIAAVKDSFINDFSFDETILNTEPIYILNSLVGGQITLPDVYSGELKVINCYSNVAGTGTPTFNFSDCTSDAIIRNWTGGLSLSAVTQGNDISIDLNSGGIIALSSCTDALFNCRGTGTLTDYTLSGVTILSDGLINRETIALADASDFGYAQGSGNGINQIQLRADASSSNAAYDPSMIIIRSGTGAGQGRMVFNYNGTTKTATVDRNWKTQPDATSYYAVMPKPGREHVNEGLALSATSSTITLNSLAADLDEVYTGQTIFIRSGTGEDQAKTVLSYDGATHVATVDAWVEVPDETSAYVMLPSGTGGGGGGGSTWSVAEKNQIRSALGVDGTKVAAVSGQLQENTVATKVAASNAEETNLKIQ